MTNDEWAQLMYFNKDEFTCKCGCGTNEMKHSFMLELDNYRHFAGIPFIVNSGYRCPDHNNAVSSTGRTGPHTTGQAADISVFGKDAQKMLSHLHRVGMTGVGLKQKGDHTGRFIHVDTLPEAAGRPRPWVWTY
jgi:uncharacterized protein YcbK (DUF882 family)